MAFVPKPQFPNVPQYPGVPQLQRSALAPPNPGPVLGTAAALGALWRGLFGQSTWGVFKQPPPVQPAADGVETVTVVAELRPVVLADSVLDFGYRNEVDIPDYPLQDGSFANYNRVNLPYEATVRLSKGGSLESRRDFLAQIDAIMNSLDLYQIITPEKTYTNVNPIRFELVRRGAGGAFFLTEVDLYFREIRTVTPQFSTTDVTTQNARSPSAAPVVNRGSVAAQAVPQPPDITEVVTQ